MPYICDENGENCQYYPDEPSGYDFGADPTNPYGIYSNWGGDTLPAMGVADDTAPGMGDRAIGVARSLFGDKAADLFKTYGPKLFDFATSKGGMAGIAALLGMLDRQKASGGGTKMGMPAPRQYTRTLTPGAYGPIAQYAANGGLMQAYAQGGEAQAYAGGKPLMMEDGGFVFTQKATKELGPRGIAALGGKMISAPGNGTDDKGITGIIGKHGVTPARVSDGESYFSEEAVERNGGPKRMYAAMNKLQRKA